MPTSAPPAPRVDRVVTVTTYNTVYLGDGEVVQLVTPYAGPYYFNIMNLGPCTVYYSDETPKPGDPNTSVIPPGGSDNGIFVCCGGGDCGNTDGENGDNGEPPTEGLDEVGLKVTSGPPCVCGPGLGPPQCPPPAKPRSCPTTITVRLVRG